MKDRQPRDEGISPQAQQIINDFKAMEEQKGLGGSTYRVDRATNGQEVVVKEKPNGEEVHRPIGNR